MQLLHAYIKYEKGFGDRDLWQPWFHSEVKNCFVIIISFLSSL